MKARLETLDLLANNLANAGAAGFKADREFYNLYLSPEATWADSPSRVPVAEGRWTDFSQGILKSTGNPTDLALSGEGFFVVQGPNGPLYTRNGSFRLSSRGVLETAEGYPVTTESGRPLQVDPAFPLEISADGVIRQGGAQVDKLKTVRFAEPQSLSKRDGTYFRWVSPAAPATSASGAEIRQGQLEAANATAGEGAVRLVGVLRQFEMLQKALTLGAEMNRRAVEEVARV